jgi:hypothetical protein
MVYTIIISGVILFDPAHGTEKLDIKWPTPGDHVLEYGTYTDTYYGTANVVRPYPINQCFFSKCQMTRDCGAYYKPPCSATDCPPFYYHCQFRFEFFVAYACRRSKRRFDDVQK